MRNEYSTPNGPRKFLASRSVQEDVDYYSAEDVEELLKEAEERLEEIAEEADPFDEPVEKSVRIEASNIHELLEKIKNLNWDDVAPNNATVGTNFDFTA